MVGFRDMKTPTKLTMIQNPKIVTTLLFLLLPILYLIHYYASFPTISSLHLLFRNEWENNLPPKLHVLFRNEWENNPPPVEGKKLGLGLGEARIAVCLVGGARRFQLTGPTIIENILEVYRNSDLFLHSPMDVNAYKLSLLKDAPRITAVKIFHPNDIPVTAIVQRVLGARKQRLLQQFNLVEGCFNMISDHQKTNNFTYDWIIRTRVDGYWSNPLGPESFIPGHYVVPVGSSFGGLNDRLGVGDFNTSKIALTWFSILPKLDSAGIRQANYETAFKAQLTTQNVKYIEVHFPFCMMTDHRYEFPPGHYGVPVASISSRGPLSGAKCRVCKPSCKGVCVGHIMDRLKHGWGWIEWSNKTLELCDAHGEWEYGWEKIFDKVASKQLANERKRIKGLKLEECVDDFEKMRNRTTYWETPPPAEICRLGLVYG